METVGGSAVNLDEVAQAAIEALPKDEISEVLASLIRGDATSLSAYLSTLETNAQVDKCEVSCHSHFLKLDGNNRPRLDALIRHISNYVLDYAIPRNQILEAAEEVAGGGSSRHLARIHTEARELFTKLEKTGEGGELLLFVMTEAILGLPQLIAKMDLKTATQMHYHGADGVHVGYDLVSERLCLYWGESKIYGDANSAIRDCLKSLAPLLKGVGGKGSPEIRDLQLLQRHLNFDDEEIEAGLKAYLNPEHPGFNQVEFRGVALVGFDYDGYPDEGDKLSNDELREALRTVLPTWKKYIQKHAKSESIESFVFHTFCVPVPSAQEFRDAFRHELGLAND